MKHYIITAIIALSISLGVLWLAPNWLPGGKTLKIEHVNGTPAIGALYTVDEDNQVVPLDFTDVAREVMPAVVHIKSTQMSDIARGPQPNQQGPDPFRDFFGEEFYEHFFGPRSPQQPGPRARIGAGSGVIINSEGYIMTNNHVIADADDIEVTLHDNRTYKAAVVGTDPSTDLALIQIKESSLATLPLVNSDEVEVGQWVMAVGNPFNLNSTVTAGIVSAKSRSINILRDQYAIESFIQTDAAINRGNSGGALVNLQGGLVGINTAIASPTGAYTGYGFAVPSNIVSKVVEDLLEYGVVQRGYLGVTIRGVDGSLAREKDLEVTSGVYVDSVLAESAAAEAGMQEGDIIVEINGIQVHTAPELQEIVARHRPGDKLDLTVTRGDKQLELNAELKNKEGETKVLAKNRNEVFNALGAEFEDLDSQTARELDIPGGVRVSKLYPGKLTKHTQMREGFIITKVDGQVVTSTEDLAKLLGNKQGGIMIEGVYEDLPGVHYYAFGLS